MKALYVDVDGTLVGPGGSLFWNGTTRVAEALLRARTAGLDVVPVSGRGETQMFELCRLLGLPRGLAELGCLIVDRSETTVLTGPSAERMQTEGALQAAIGLGLTLHGGWNKDRVATWLLRGRVDAVSASAELAAHGYGWCELLDNGQLHQSEDHTYHLVPAGFGKPAGVRADRERHGLRRADTGFVGDSASDLSCAPEVGRLWLVANADPALQWDVRTTGSYGDGVAEVIAEVLAVAEGRPGVR